MGYSHLTDEEIMEVLNDISNGVLYKDIAEKYHIDNDSCKILAKRYGITQARRKERLKQNDRIIELYQEGYNYAEIGKIVGCSHSNVTQVLDKYGIPRYRKRRNVDIIKRNDEISKLYQTGNYTMQELGDMFDLSYTYIGQVITRTLHVSSDKYLDIRDAKVSDMVNEGKTNKEISQELSISKNTVASEYYNNQNHRKRMNKRNAKIVELYRSGNYTMRELGDMFDLTKSTIYRIILKYRK